ncbi:MAG: SNF2 family helicase [Chitinophagaceae bacterium]|nr:SNF2 family helicase [Chitinophagaceae bacterium]
MSEKKTGTKTVLLLQPQKMLHRRPVVQLLKVEKRGNGILEMDELAITSATLSLYLKNIDLNARKQLLKFSEYELDNEVKRIETTLKKVRYSEKEESAHRDRAMARYYQQYLGFLKSFDKDISWYHRVTIPGSNRVSTVPCVYHPLSVKLEFECIRQEDNYNLLIWVKTQQGRIPLADFRRFYFLLLKNNEYWHLSLSAFEALDWLEETDLSKLNRSKETFLNEVVSPLKKFGQTVDTGGLVEKESLDVLPVKRLLLSELNNTFLMMTPQYIYDGYVIDGAFEPFAEVKSGDSILVINRHKDEESSFNNYLKALHPNFPKQSNGYYYLNFAEAQKKQWFSKVYHQLLTDDVELVGMDMLRHFRYSPFKPETSVNILATESDVIKVDFQLKFGKEKVPMNELQKMLLNGQKVVLLKDGSMGVLGDEWLRQYGSVIKHARIKGKELWLPKWMAMSMEGEDDMVSVRRTLPVDWIDRWEKWRKGDEPLYALPQNVQVESLRPYQQKGYDWISLLAEAGGSACLADDMGLGKTLQTICFIANRIHHYPNSKHLVVCPASLMYNWQQEFEKFATGIPTVIYHGQARTKEMLDDADVQVVITSYGTMRQDIEILSQVEFDVVVIDESHHIKNPTTQISRAIHEIKSNTRVALSGTPVMNGTLDLYAQLNFLLPGLLGSREFFKKEYIIPIEQQGDADKAATLQRIIAPFVLRRTKEQVAKDLPPKTETILWCTMGQDQKAAYESIKDNVRSSVLLDIEQNGLQKGKMGILAGLTKLRQACNSCELVKDEDLFTYDSIKTEVLIEELKNIIPAHKALVFSQFTSMLDLLERDLQKAGIRFQRLDGSTEVHKRQELVNEFQDENTDVQVFLLSLKAGNAGLTLTAADYVFLFDPWWNAAVENQAIDRTHRIGQEKHVFAYRMICKGTVEEKILRMQQRKKKLAEELITTDEGFMQSLTIEDVKYLLE